MKIAHQPYIGQQHNSLQPQFSGLSFKDAIIGASGVLVGILSTITIISLNEDTFEPIQTTTTVKTTKTNDTGSVDSFEPRTTTSQPNTDSIQPDTPQETSDVTIEEIEQLAQELEGALNFKYLTHRYELAHPGEHYTYDNNNPPSQRAFEETVVPTKEQESAKHLILLRLAQMLIKDDEVNQGRLLETLKRAGITIELYNSVQSLDDPQIGKVGATAHCDLIQIQYPVFNVYHSFNNPNDGYEVIAHELITMIDCLPSVDDANMSFDHYDGLLPQWNSETQALYIEARELEKEKIINGTSPMDRYALTEDGNFLSVLTETFLECPIELQESNEVLYHIMAQTFGFEPIKGRTPTGCQ